MKRRLLILGIGSLLAAATAAYAHHSFARDYAEDKQISLEGDVVSFEYRNPHAWVTSPPTIAAAWFASSGRNGRTRDGWNRRASPQPI